jgi:hypothetical protein
VCLPCLPNPKSKAVAEEFGREVKMKNGKLVIENLADIELTIQLLAEFYKVGRVFGGMYGTYAGKPLIVGKTSH